MRGGHDIILSAFDNFKEVPTNFYGSPVRQCDGAASCTLYRVVQTEYERGVAKVARSDDNREGTKNGEAGPLRAHICIIRTVRSPGAVSSRISEKNND